MNATQQQTKQDLDNLARLQQMKINTRLTALQTSLELMKMKGYLPIDGGNAASSVDMVCLLATAQEVENYILGSIEAETTAALEKAKVSLGTPRLLRP